VKFIILEKEEEEEKKKKRNSASADGMRNALCHWPSRSDLTGGVWRISARPNERNNKNRRRRRRRFF
jgi:hypothetical protein